MWKYSRKLTGAVLALCLMFGFPGKNFAQKIENIDGVSTVHNGDTGLWGKNPQIDLKFVKTIGSLETADENLMFYMPVDVTVDHEGNIYVLDQGNYRIQKFDRSGKYLQTFGRDGQGPGEFRSPTSITIDNEGNLFVGDEQNKRIQVFFSNGKSKQTIRFDKIVGNLLLKQNGNIVLSAFRGVVTMDIDMSDKEAKAAPLLMELNTNGEKLGTFGIPFEYEDPITKGSGNNFDFAIDRENNTFVSFKQRNRIEKYSNDGELVLRIDRELNYEEMLPPTSSDMTIVGADGKAEKIKRKKPNLRDISYGIGVDGKGRIWVATADRMIREDEKAGRHTSVSMGAGGQYQMSVTVQGATDNLKTDMLKLEVFAPTGELLGAIPLTHFCDRLRIFGDKLYIVDEVRGMQVYEYSIVEK
ncbi:6-bladed beta-propeller [candidate division KSB1 bacterium]